MKAYHNIEPIYNKDSKILILGSFPSVKSREASFYYYHPQNRFWKILANIFNEDINDSIEDKKSFLIRHNIALWDVIASCDIIGSSDNSISNVVVNDLNKIIKESKIEYIYTNGTLADKLYHRYFNNDIAVIKLPSSSPANASYSLERLTKIWSIIKNPNY